MMSTRRSLFLFGALLSTLVLFGAATVFAQNAPTVPVADDFKLAAGPDFGEISVSWRESGCRHRG